MGSLKPTWVTADGCRMYFTYSGGFGTVSHIYFAARPPLAAAAR